MLLAACSASAHLPVTTEKHPEEADRDAIIAASLDRLSKEVRSLHTAQPGGIRRRRQPYAPFSNVHSGTAPGGLDQAKRRARLRYDRDLLSDAQNMASDSRTTMTELMDRG